jgi:hypothetical protein
VKGTGVSLRAPEGCVFDPVARTFTHPELKILISVLTAPGTFAANEKAVENALSMGETKVHSRKDISDGKLKAMLYEGETAGLTSVPVEHTFAIVVGDEDRSAFVVAHVPKNGNLAETMRECVISIRWERSAATFVP